MNLLKYRFAACAPMHTSGCLTNVTQIYAWTPFAWGAQEYTLFCDNVIMDLGEKS